MAGICRKWQTGVANQASGSLMAANHLNGICALKEAAAAFHHKIAQMPVREI